MTTGPPPEVGDLRCEARVEPLGIDTDRPRLRWRFTGDGAARRGLCQTAYEVRAGLDRETLQRGADLVWSSGVVASDESAHVRWGGPALVSRTQYHWQVRATDENGTTTAWSPPTWFETGLLAPSDWSADWIEAGWDEDPKAPKPAPHFRRAFDLPGPVRRARVYSTARGVYELRLNGEVVGVDALRPRWTSFDHRIEYQTYDVTDLLREGTNAIGAIVGDGKYRGKLSVMSARNNYGSRTGLLVQLEVDLVDGSTATLGTDGSWRSTTGPIISSDPKDGEVYDARLELTGWDRPGFDDAAWKAVRLGVAGTARLVAPVAPPIVRRERFAAERIDTPDGAAVLDFGQNLFGHVRFDVVGPADSTIELEHGEALDEHGNFSLAHLRPKPFDPLLARERYTLRGDPGGESYEPHFANHGFRYVKVIGWPGGRPDPAAFEAVAVYSDLDYSGTFACSNPLLNQLHHNVAWSMRGNFAEVPTDCPTRELSPWTGDAQLFASTAAFLADTSGFFSHWLTDVALEQSPDGAVPNVVPGTKPKGPKALQGLSRFTEGSAGWGDAAVLVPWAMYRAYGDLDVLERQYPSMRAWVDRMARIAAEKRHVSRRLRRRRPHERHLWDTGFHYGEWLEPDDKAGGLALATTIARLAVTSSPSVATAYLVHSSDVLARIATLLGQLDDADRYRDLAAGAREAWAIEFIGDDGRLLPDTQATYVRALAFDLVPADRRPAFADRLAELVHKAGDHLGTGFLATPLLCDVLADNGHLDVAYRLLEQTTKPSWLYAVTTGATTIWETWNGVDEDGKPDSSLNHYSYGAVARFLHERVAGLRLDPQEPGYRRLVIAPQPGGTLTAAHTGLDTAYGRAEVGWTRSADGELTVTALVPPNTTATIRLPGAAGGRVETDSLGPGVAEGPDLTLEAGPGRYELRYRAVGEVTT